MNQHSIPAPIPFLILDRTGWHMMIPRLVVPHTITLFILSSRSPRSKPVETIWQFMRDEWFSNRFRADCDDIVTRRDAWTKLVDQPWTMISLAP